MQVSAYKNTWDTNGDNHIKLGDFFKAVKRGKWKTLIEAVLAIPEGPIQDAAKQKLPGITPSGTFSEGKLDEGLITHSGIVCLDIDKNEPHYFQAITSDPHTFVVHKSTRQNGWAVYVKVDPECNTVEHHKELVRALITYYEERYQIKVDPTCKNPSRLRYVSFDPDLWGNRESVVWFKREEAKKAALGEYKGNKLPLEIAIFRTEKMFTKAAGSFGSKGERHDWVMNLLVWLNRAGVPFQDALNHVTTNYPIPERNYVVEHRRTAEHVYEKNAASFGTHPQPRVYDAEDAQRWPQYRAEMLEWYVTKLVAALDKYKATIQKPSADYIEIQTRDIQFLAQLWKSL